MTNDGAINRLLYAILSQKCLKDIDWNKVAHDPILSQEITNGHAARMRYSRFKKQMDGTTSMPTRPRKIPTPRRSRIEKKKAVKREPNFKPRKESPDNAHLPFRMKSESQDPHPCASSSMTTTNTEYNNPQSIFPKTKFEPSTPVPSHLKMKTETDLSIPIPLPTTPSESSRLPTPFLMNSPTSPHSPTFPTPGVVSLNTSMSSTSSLNNRMMDTSFFGPPLYEQTAHKEPMGIDHRGEMRYCYDPWEQDIGRYGNVARGVEDGDRVMFKREETYGDASYSFY